MRRATLLPGAAALLLLLIPGAPGAVAQEPLAEAKARLQEVDQALSEWDLAQAKEELQQVRTLVPAHLEAVDYFAGRIAFEEGRYADAVQLLKSAGIDDKPGSYLKLAQDTQATVRDDVQTQSAHFILSTPRGKDELLAPYALQTLEAIRAALLQDLGHAPEGKVRVEVVNNAQELAKVSTLTLEQINTTGTIAICKFNKLMITSPKAVASGYDWQDTLAHEYTHLVVTQLGHNTVPIWLQEALAKYLETRWRGPPGQGLSPSQQALLAQRVKANRLVPFAKMHPSMAMLPSWQDANTAFAEVFYAADYIYQQKGDLGFRNIIQELSQGRSDEQAVAIAMGESFPAFEKGWLQHIRAQPLPAQAIPPSDDRVVLKGSAADPHRGRQHAAQKGEEISFEDFLEVDEPKPRRFAHLGELFRERHRLGAAADELGKAHALVGDRYEPISNKYALTLLALQRTDEAERVLLGSLRLHPSSAQSQVHLGRIYLARHDWSRARERYFGALAIDPFDPEIHLALLRIAEGLKDRSLADQERKASAVLTGWSPSRVEEVAQLLAPPNGDLSQMKVPTTPP